MYGSPPKDFSLYSSSKNRQQWDVHALSDGRGLATTSYTGDINKIGERGRATTSFTGRTHKRRQSDARDRRPRLSRRAPPVGAGARVPRPPLTGPPPRPSRRRRSAGAAPSGDRHAPMTHGLRKKKNKQNDDFCAKNSLCVNRVFTGKTHTDGKT